VAGIRIVLGLGNPGPRYRASRHNLGFRVIDRLAEARNLILESRSGLGLNAEIGVYEGPAGRVVLAKPSTFMNRSGRSGAALRQHYDVEPAAFLVVYDDVALDLGRLRVRGRGSAGGHNGVSSLIEAWQNDEFPRVRLGIRGGHDGDEEDLADYVLNEFPVGERAVAQTLVEAGAAAVDCILEHGLTVAMNEFNARNVGVREKDSEQALEE
jgi:PTH1 family peptidyl-tRNA hydrolase